VYSYVYQESLRQRFSNTFSSASRGFSQTFVTIVKVMGPEAFRPNRCLVEDGYGKPILAAVFVFNDPYGKKSGVGKTSVKTLSVVKTILKYLLQQGADPKEHVLEGTDTVSEYEYKRKTVTDFAHDFSCFNLWVKVSKEGGFDVDDIIQYRPKRTMVPSAEGSKRTCSIPRL
jgi:hypothetical protein